MDWSRFSTFSIIHWQCSRVEKAMHLEKSWVSSQASTIYLRQNWTCRHHSRQCWWLLFLEFYFSLSREKLQNQKLISQFRFEQIRNLYGSNSSSRHSPLSCCWRLYSSQRPKLTCFCQTGRWTRNLGHDSLKMLGKVIRFLWCYWRYQFQWCQVDCQMKFFMIYQVLQRFIEVSVKIR